MSGDVPFTLISAHEAGVSEQQGDAVVVFDFDFDASDLVEDSAERAEPKNPAVVTGTINLGAPKQFLALNKKHTITATYSVKVASNDEIIPAQKMVVHLSAPGVMKTPRSASKAVPTVKTKNTKVISTSITVTGITPTKAGEFALTGTVQYHGELFEKSVVLVVE